MTALLDLEIQAAYQKVESLTISFREANRTQALAESELQKAQQRMKSLQSKRLALERNPNAGVAPAFPKGRWS